MAQEPSELDGEGTPDVGVDGPETAYGRHGLRKDAGASRHLRLEGCRGSQKTQPQSSTSEVRRFLRKHHARRHGPLGDRSLPQRSSGEIRVAEIQLSVTVQKTMKPAGLKTTEDSEESCPLVFWRNPTG